MRLGQLARKLSLRPSQLVDFLVENNIQTEEGSNTRLADEHTQLIVQHFAPESLEEIMRPVAEEVPQPQAEPVVEESVLIEPEQKEEVVTVSEDKPEDQQLEPEVIRVQKIELSGLKVLGKIDLPEPKKKEPKTEGEVSGEEQPKPERRSPAKSKHPRRESDQRNWRNPMEVQRQREARELEERRRAEIEREKEKRKHHYQNKVKQVKQPKRSKPSKEIVTVKKTVDTRPVPKTWVGKVPALVDYLINFL
jgi:hypothetical protein